jgi:hypothetical protein
MSKTIDPQLLRKARTVALKVAGKARLDFDDCIGCAYLALAELAAKRDLTAPHDLGLVAVMVKTRIIDWQRMDSPLTRDEIRARAPMPVHVSFDDVEVGAEGLPIGEPWVRRAIMRLDRRLRDAVIACYFFDVSHVEYGRRIGRTDAMVSVMLKEAREQLRQFLVDDFS